jgi:hypothetical protein
MSAFMYYANEHRAELVRNRPDIPFNEIGSELGKMWSNASQDEKNIYEEKAQLDRLRYEIEMEEYEVISRDHSDRAYLARD